MKKIGFLSFGYWSDHSGSQVRSAADALAQSVELAIAAEEVGIDGAYFRVHHFAEQQSTPFVLMSAIAARTRRLEVGTGVVDMRYESALHLSEQVASLDLLSGGKVQLGIGRGSPERADRGYEHFGHVPDAGKTPTDLAHEHTRRFLSAIRGEPVASTPGRGRPSLPVTPQSPRLHERVLWGAGNLETAVWAARQGLQLMSSTLIIDEKGIPFSELQLEQIEGFRAVWRQSGWGWAPKVTVVRSIVPLVDDLSRAYFASGPQNEEGVGQLGGIPFRYGTTFVGEPEQLVARLRQDVALESADALLVTIPSQLGVEFNTRQLAAVHAIGTELGWGS